MGEPEEIRAATVSINFKVIDVAPKLGRGFTAEEERPGSERVVILSHALWQRRFGGRSRILNKTISLSGISNTVLGIMPPGFQFPENTDMWNRWRRPMGCARRGLVFSPSNRPSQTGRDARAGAGRFGRDRESD